MVERMKKVPNLFTIYDYEVEHILATIEVLEFEAEESGNVSEEMVQEAKDILSGLEARAKSITDIIKEYGNADKAKSDEPDTECAVESK